MTLKEGHTFYSVLSINIKHVIYACLKREVRKVHIFFTHTDYKFPKHMYVEYDMYYKEYRQILFRTFNVGFNIQSRKSFRLSWYVGLYYIIIFGSIRRYTRLN